MRIRDVIDTGIWTIGVVWVAAFPLAMLELHGPEAATGAIAVTIMGVIVLGWSGERAVRSIDQVVDDTSGVDE